MSQIGTQVVVHMAIRMNNMEGAFHKTLQHEDVLQDGAVAG